MSKPDEMQRRNLRRLDAYLDAMLAEAEAQYQRWLTSRVDQIKSQPATPGDQ